ncbi:MAG: acetolactate synthase small subunit [Thermotaleaceae bacterium]
MRHTLSVLVENHPGVLSRVSGLFSRRGFNIESLAVSVTEDPSISRMTIMVDGDDAIVEQVTKQLNKLIDVIKVFDISQNSVMRELALIKVNANASDRNEIIQIGNIFRAKVVDLSKTSITLEITGDSAKISALEELLRPFGIKEIVRTGAIGIDRGSKTGKQHNGSIEESNKLEG